MRQPIYLLADSQLLFWRDNGILWLQSVRERIMSLKPKAAYVGASNGDKPEFYAIFEAAMNGIGIRDCQMIRAQARVTQAWDMHARDMKAHDIQARGTQALDMHTGYMKAHDIHPRSGQEFAARVHARISGEDEAFVGEADLILLAGGDVEKGWNLFMAVGLDEMLRKRYHEGAILIGISAGAIQLGMLGWGGDGGVLRLFETLKLVPFIIGAHEEEQDWETLKEVLGRAKDLKEAQPRGRPRGLGIPTGGGVIYTPEQGVKTIRRPFVSFG